MNRLPPRTFLLLTAVFCLAGPQDTLAQGMTYTLALREVRLADAIERFVGATGIAVSYQPELVRGHTASCAAEQAGAEEVLDCILNESGLDFYRLSSGTYVLTESVEIAPERGYLAGKVVDVETGSPVSGAHVQLAEADLGAVTDGSGRFAFPALLPGPYVVSISHLGYRSWTDSLSVRSNEQVQTEAVLQPETIVITPVVVDGLQNRPPFESLGRATLDRSAAPVGRASDITSRPYRSAETISGVRLNHVTADVHVQGGDPGAHQMRLDGVPVFLPWSMAGFVGPFGNLALDKITVRKAGFGAPHGSQLSGVLLAEHALSPVDDVDVQADPYSLNARVRLAPNVSRSRDLAVMAAGRVGLWDVAPPSRLRSTLEDWSRADPFLVLAALDDPESDRLVDIGSIASPVNPSVRFSDLHAAAEMRFGPLRSVHASFYEGLQSLSGGVLSGSRSTNQTETREELTVADDYEWTNRLAQLGYDAVLGSRTLASVQARASRYRMRNAYEVIDSLHTVLQNGSARITEISTTPVHDGNRASVAAVEGNIDHAFERHRLSVGAESGVMASRFVLQSVYFPDREAGFSNDADLEVGDFAATQGTVENSSEAWYTAAFGEERIRLGEMLDAELGVRLTYLHPRRTVYAEPRLALLIRGTAGSFGAWSARTAAGVYRQFLNQTDASKLNAGAILPSVRVWLPVDATVRPPAAYHLTQELLLQPRPQWMLRVDGYLKYEPHGLALAYAPADSSRFLSGSVTQAEFLVDARKMTVGADVTLAWDASFLRAEARYGYETAQREGPDLFEGRRHPVPWSEPHRLELAVDWLPLERIAVSARWEGVWQRPWGFRKVYYDYFGHSADTRRHDPFDLGEPGSHVLPPLYQLDLSLSYTQPLGGADVRVRAEVINLLNRENVLDWRLVRDGATWRREPRMLYPLMPSLAIRVGF